MFSTLKERDKNYVIVVDPRGIEHANLQKDSVEPEFYVRNRNATPPIGP
jgi:hypothetical protein